MNSKDKLHLAAITGMLAPVIFVTVFTVEGWHRPGYDSRSTFVSALSLGPRGWVQISNFIVFGILFLIFSTTVFIKYREEKIPVAGPVIFIIMALCFLFSGPFVMDPMDTPRADASLHGLLHGIFGGIVFTLMPVSCFVFLHRFSTMPDMQRLRPFTLVSAIVITVAVVALTLATKIPALATGFKPWLGFIQRCAIIPFMIWLFAFAFLSRSAGTKWFGGDADHEEK